MERAQKIQILQNIIKIKSVNGNEKAVLRYLSSELRNFGIESTLLPFANEPERANLLVEIGQGKDPRVLGLTGHADTVAVTNDDDWKFPPFSATILDDKLYGRGAADMKSGLAAEVIALIELVEKQQEPAGIVRLLLTAGEEFGAPGAYQFLPEKIKDLSALIVGEATDGNVTFAHSGSINYRITSQGKPAHSSTPELGINAITGLAKFLAVEAHLFDKAPHDEVLGEVQHSVTVIEGGNQVNTIPARATLLGNVRPTTSFDNQAVISTIQAALDRINQESSYKLKFELLHDFYPIETEANHAFVQLALKISQMNYQDRKPKLIVNNGASDASVFVQTNPKMPVILLGPDKDQSSHQIDEHTTISSYLTTIAIYEQLITDYFRESSAD
ncbi:Acetylornithine deacetylase [Fructilactobacillus florum 8D]|uniref:Probable succinyl-diaminopimelate desuccinylase n=2 Tax=Fructilactobacillus florum TaxID=640331 RepID=W9EIY2_9LACO|nr:ArgE/DapE family deacylase [Fructilactobacillus florum]ETO40925.1 Acetylornithine deacetylase [Fructilactobacillus florum 8D]KRM91372.1 hypothetical protein FC87_GL000883 [Fructilactobacillus florum DSM 22689 = JCM 16035]